MHRSWHAGRISWLLIGILVSPAIQVQAREDSRGEIVGEAFGNPVRAEAFAYYYKTAALFTRSGKQGQRSEDEVRQEAWQDLVLLKEANRLGIKVERSELEAELKRLLAEKDIKYGTPQYASWVSSTFKENVPVFERRLEDLLRINKFMSVKLDPEVTVTREEMLQKYLNEYNSFESEYIGFNTPEDAEAFLARVKQDHALWKATFERKRTDDGQKGAAWINIMSVEALIDLWKIPKEDASRILGSQEGDFVAAHSYYGPAVFRLLWRQTASEEKFDDKQEAHYRQLLTTVKKHQASKAYFDELVARAQLRDYEQERKNAEQHKDQEATIAKLKERSTIVLQTTQGNLTLQLWPDVAPKACENFIGLVERGYYDGLTFHRIVKDFMIQGGDPTGTGAGGESIWGKPFEDETHENVTFDRPGLLAMANSGPNTNASQFFITTVPTAWLNGKHTIFGEVISGMDVVKRLDEVPTDSANKPLQPQKIIKVTIKNPPSP